MLSQRPSVLIVDDDSAIRFTVRLVLEGADYQVTEASCGASALQRLRESPDRLVVLLDWQMPEMDGRQVLQAVAADETLATRHSYVLMTAHPEAQTTCADVLTPLGATVMLKPFGLDLLLDTVEQTVARMEAIPVE